MKETEYYYEVDMNSGKLNRKVLCVCRLLLLFCMCNFVVLHLKMSPHLQMNNNKITDEQQEQEQQQQQQQQQEQSMYTQYSSVHLCMRMQIMLTSN